MQIVETVLFPHNDEFAGLRWIKGSGLQQLDKDANVINQMLDQAHIQVDILPQRGLKVVHKTGGCLIVGDPATRQITLNDQANRLNPRLLATAKAAQAQDIKLYQQQNKTLLGAAGGIRGRLKTQIDAQYPAAGTDAPWALVSATYTPHDTGVDETFIAQADAHGEFVLDLAGIRWPDDESKPQFKLTIKSQENLNPKQPADPDQFVSFDISSDGTVGNLATEFTLTLDNYGEIKQLGNLLVAKNT